MAIPSLAFVFCAACASSTVTPDQNAASSSGAIRAAEEVGATHTPEAALHLQLAKEQFERARSMTDKKDKDQADRLLLRAQADAELSLALARTESEKAEAQSAMSKVKALKESVVQ